MGCRRHDLGVGDRVLVTSEDFASYQASEVGHIDHKHSTDFVGNLAHLCEIHAARVGGVSGDDDKRLKLAGQLSDLAVVEQARLRVGAVGALVKHLSGDIGAETVGKVASSIEAHADRPLVIETMTQGVPVDLSEVIDSAGVKF